MVTINTQEWEGIVCSLVTVDGGLLPPNTEFWEMRTALSPYRRLRVAQLLCEKLLAVFSRKTATSNSALFQQIQCRRLLDFTFWSAPFSLGPISFSLHLKEQFLLLEFQQYLPIFSCQVLTLNICKEFMKET